MNSLKQLLLLTLSIGFLFAQGFNHPELEWQTIEGKYFIVHYHQNTEWTANEALHVADDIYPSITSLYQYEPEEKTHLIIRDTDDYANGAAYYFDNKIEIWAKPLDYELRGSHYWLRDVITHEFAHIVSLRASRKFPAQIPAAYFQVIAYEPERREDVLYGYPNGIGSYPLPSVVVPMWWAEGIAQFQSDSMRWDWWDSIRDMILRDRIKYGKLLTLSEMDGFGKVGIGNESVYDHGFSLVNHIAANYGQDALQRITQRISGPLNYNFYKAVETELGIASQNLWKQWRSDLMLLHKQSFAPEEETSPVHFIQREGDANFYPRYNATGTALGFISSSGETYLSRTSLFVKDSSDKAIKLIPSAEGFDWSPDGEQLVYARKEYYNGGIPDPRTRHHHNREFAGGKIALAEGKCSRCDFLLSGSSFSDLFIVDREDSDEETQLTFGERVKNPSWSPDGDMIAFVNLRDGTNNLCLSFPEHADSVRQLTYYAPGTQLYVPRWSPDSKKIIFDYTGGSNRDIAIYDLEGDSLISVLSEVWDERNPVFKSDSVISYSDDRTGVFNIYDYDLNTSTNPRLTNVNGGAFQAEWHGDRLVYSLYDSLGFNIAFLDESELLKAETIPVEASVERIIEPSWERHASSLPSKEYGLQYGPLFLLPRLQLEIDNSKNDYMLKPGFYFFSDEILNNYSLLGGFGLAPNLDMDLYISSQYRGFLPTITLEFFQMIRHTQEELLYLDGVYKSNSELTFSLTQGILSFDVKIPPMFGLTLDFSASNYSTAIAPHTVFGIDVGGTRYDYFKGWDWGLKWDMSHINLRQERGINPSGYEASVSIRDNHHKFVKGYGYDESTEAWGNLFTPHRYLKLNMSGFYGLLLPIPGQFVLSNTTEINLIDNNTIDDFFYEYAGGLPGLRAYPFYSMQGSRRVVSTSSLRFPVFRDNYRRVGHLTVRDLYLGLHAQMGAAWSADPENISLDDLSAWISHEREQINLVRDVGVDLRLALNSYYAFPTAIEVGAYYGLDDVTVIPSDNMPITYGGEWRYYWKVLFGFE